MTCYHPIKAFIIDHHPNNKLHFASVDTEYIIDNHQKIEEYVLLPCGKCIGCQMDRSRDWANRMMLELKYHDCASFVTLTYDEEHVPYSEIPDEDGEFHKTLVKKDLQNFLKRLRKQIAPVKIRFFACGEYGPKHHRPHYHLIIFGYDFSEDRQVYCTENGIVNYRSPLLERIWTNPKPPHESLGFSMLSDVNWNTCAYVSRYCTKKLSPGHNIYYQSLGIEPEFNTMSRRPGLGRQYYEDNKERLYIKSETPEIFLTNLKGGFTTAPPKYFDRLCQNDFPFQYDYQKEKRKEIAEQEMKNKLSNTTKTLGEYLRDEEKYFVDRISSLRREKA